MRKFLTIVLIIALVSALVACGDSKQDNTTTEAVTTTNTTTVAQTTTAAVTEPTTTAAQETTDGIPVLTDKWEAMIPNDWIVDEERSWDSTASTNRTVSKLDASREEICSIFIGVSIEPAAYSFRRNLINSGITLESYLDRSAVGREISGAFCLDVINRDDSQGVQFPPEYRGRFEKKRSDLTVIVSGEISGQMENINKIVDSITVITEDRDRQDEPYPWEGEPYTPKTAAVKIGDYQFDATWIKQDVINMPTMARKTHIAYAAGYLYLLNSTSLKVYTMEADALSLAHDIVLPTTYETMQADYDGSIYLSCFSARRAMLVYKGDVKEAELETGGHLVSMHPSGTWGLTYYMDARDIGKITINEEGKVESEAFELKNSDGTNPVNQIDNFSINDSHVIIFGSKAGSATRTGFIFDLEGNLIQELKQPTDEEIIVSNMDCAVETENGFIGLDSNDRVMVWGKTGDFLGRASLDELLGIVNGSGTFGMSRGDDGNIYIGVAGMRPDNSWDETVVFRLETDF